MNKEKINKDISAIVVCREDDVRAFLPVVKELANVCSFFYAPHEAFVYFSQNKVDIIIIDCKEPSEAALKLVSAIRKENPAQLILAGVDSANPDIINDLSILEARVFLSNRFSEKAFRKVLQSAVKDIISLYQNDLNSNYLEALLNALEKSSRLVLLLNADGQVEYANKQFLKTSGFTENEIIGKSPVEFFINDESIKNIIEYNSQLLQDEGWNGEFKVNKKNGDILWVRASVTPIKDLKGGRRLYLKLFEDISDKMKYSENLTNLSAKISEKVREQTLELHKARIKAEKANLAKTQFLAKISHELRTPLNGIIGMTQLMQGSALTSQQSQNIDIIQKSADSLLNIINDILDYSSIEAGKFKFENKIFSIRDIINITIELLSANARIKGLNLSAKIDKNVPEMIIGDAKRLQQALINIIGNAIKFTKEGFVSLQVKAIKKDSESSELFFKVQDTGVGITEDVGDSIFEYYKQTEIGSTYTGSGLGLAITKEIVEKMEGSIWFDSVPSNGSAFYFTAKFKLPPYLSAESKKFSVAFPVKEPKDYNKLNANILIAEDSSINQEVLKQALELKDCKVIIASTGREAVDIFNKHDFDLIFMDLQMPELNGFEATKLIRESRSKNGQLIPIIGLTAHVEEEYRKNCIFNGMNEFIAKPYRWADIYEMIERFLGCHQVENNASLPINDEALLENNGFDLIPQSVQKFFSAKKRDMKKIREALYNKDVKKLPVLLQKFKVETINIGALKSSEYINEMEYLMNNGSLDLVDSILSELESELEKVESYLRAKYLENNPA